MKENIPKELSKHIKFGRRTYFQQKITPGWFFTADAL